MSTVKKVSILGSTGSIGTQALEVIKENCQLFEVVALTAQNNWQLLVKQAINFQPQLVVIGNSSFEQEVKKGLKDTKCVVASGSEGLIAAASYKQSDIVLTALVGYAGLLPTIAAIESGKTIALANKETLVVAGQIINKLLHDHQVKMIPVDSEHSAIFQCLQGEEVKNLKKIILTASGGPFRGYKQEQLREVKKEQALRHPNWDMGAKITIDSASLMNKGLEVIEAHWLFNLPAEKIQVVVHPQSVIHSMVEFEDTSIKAQLGYPDMRLPIAYALGYPDRISGNFKPFDFTDYPQLTFEKPDMVTFRNLHLAFEAMKMEGNMPCILNAANEIAVDLFLKDQISFLGMPELIETVMEKMNHIANPTLDDLINTDKETRIKTTEVAKEWKD